jgi:RimJ/RimL family protein N-acetyltransferase
VNEVIFTERLALRPLRPTDAEPLLALFNNWQVVRWLSEPPWPYTIADAVEFVLSRATETPVETNFAIALDDNLIGGIGMRMKDASPLQAGAGPYLGYWLGQPYWGRGYMTEAARGIITGAFVSGVGETIYSGAFAGNTASLRVQEKLGFVRVGESALFCKPRGAEHTHVNTLLTRGAFEARTT